MMLLLETDAASEVEESGRILRDGSARLLEARPRIVTRQGSLTPILSGNAVKGIEGRWKSRRHVSFLSPRIKVSPKNMIDDTAAVMMRTEKSVGLIGACPAIMTTVITAKRNVKVPNSRMIAS